MPGRTGCGHPAQNRTRRATMTLAACCTGATVCSAVASCARAQRAPRGAMLRVRSKPRLHPGRGVGAHMRRAQSIRMRLRQAGSRASAPRTVYPYAAEVRGARAHGAPSAQPRARRTRASAPRGSIHGRLARPRRFGLAPMHTRTPIPARSLERLGVIRSAAAAKPADQPARRTASCYALG
jgi:hypothetical protein